MSKLLKMVAVAAALTVAPMAANAFTVTATNADGPSDGVSNATTRSDVDNALDGTVATFFSLGVGGELEIDVSPSRLISPASVIEITFGSPNEDFPESAQIFFGGILAGEIFNQEVGGVLFTEEAGFDIEAVENSIGVSFTITFSDAAAFSTLTLVDTTGVNFASEYSNLDGEAGDPTTDGFDIANVSVNAVPLPASALLLLGALGGFGLLSRKRQTAA